MSAAGLLLGVAGALAVLAFVMNHVTARLGLLELTLNEGLPPGHQRLPTAGHPQTGASAPVFDGLEPGLHLVLSRNCHACQRLVSELTTADVVIHAPVRLRYVDRPRPIADDAAARLGAQLTTDEQAFAVHHRADPLPFTMAIGDHGLSAGRATPTLAAVLDVARDAGIETAR